MIMSGYCVVLFTSPVVVPEGTRVDDLILSSFKTCAPALFEDVLISVSLVELMICYYSAGSVVILSERFLMKLLALYDTEGRPRLMRSRVSRTTMPAVHTIRISARIILCIFLVLLSSATAPLDAHAGYDTSLRIDQNVNLDIDDRVQLVTYLFHQIDKNVTEYDYIEFGTGLQYQMPLKWLSFLLYYQQSYARDDDNTWLLEKKPSVNVNTLAFVSRFKVTNQIRYEYRVTPEWHDFRIKEYLVISLVDGFLVPHLGWELYYENQYKDLMLQRINIGITGNVYKTVSLGAYYRMDFAKKDRHWEFSRQLMGISATIRY